MPLEASSPTLRPNGKSVLVDSSNWCVVFCFSIALREMTKIQEFQINLLGLKDKVVDPKTAPAANFVLCISQNLTIPRFPVSNIYLLPFYRS